MKQQKYFRPVVCIVLLSHLLTSCHTKFSIENPANIGGSQPQEVIASTQLAVQPAPNNGSTENEKAILSVEKPIQEKGNNKVTTSLIEDKVAVTTALGDFSRLPKDVLQAVMDYAGQAGRCTMRQLNSTFYQSMTGYPKPGITDLNQKPQPSLFRPSWVLKRNIDFAREKYLKLLPTISSFVFYQLLGSVDRLQETFWPYVKESNIHEINLSSNLFNDTKIAKLLAYIKGSKVKKLGLRKSSIGISELTQLAACLKDTGINQLDLSGNKMDLLGVQALAGALQNANIHSLNLSRNEIDDKGAQALASALQGSPIRMLDLIENEIGYIGAQALADALKGTPIQTLDLTDNQICAAEAKALKKALKGVDVRICEYDY